MSIIRECRRSFVARWLSKVLNSEGIRRCGRAALNIIFLRQLPQMVWGDELGHNGHRNDHKCTDDDDDEGGGHSGAAERGALVSKTSISSTTGAFLINGDDVDIR